MYPGYLAAGEGGGHRETGLRGEGLQTAHHQTQTRRAADLALDNVR